MDRWRDEPEIRATVVALAAAAVLVAAGTAGVGASPLFVVGAALLAVPLWPLGAALADTAWQRVDPHAFAADLWLGPVVAALVVAAFLDATPDEVQALGGLVGLVGMANYFLRPVYRLLYGLARRLSA
jgi:drug/metabolite transporter (DMT)-like permease